MIIKGKNNIDSEEVFQLYVEIFYKNNALSNIEAGDFIAKHGYKNLVYTWWDYLKMISKNKLFAIFLDLIDIKNKGYEKNKIINT